MAESIRLKAICIRSCFLGIFIKINISAVKRRLEVLKGAACRLFLVLSAEGLMSFVGSSNFDLGVLDDRATFEWNWFAFLV